MDGTAGEYWATRLILDKLTILQCENHEKLTQWGVIPLLGIDVWEHASYLKYKNKRNDFVDTIRKLLIGIM